MNDEEELTHFGRTLGDIEKFDDPRSDSENDEDRLGGKLYCSYRFSLENVVNLIYLADLFLADFVETVNFGGLFTKRKEANDKSEGGKLRKDYIEELIAKSKQQKVRIMLYII